MTIRIQHGPSGIVVEGHVAEGAYSKKEMQQRRSLLEQELIALLAVKVAKSMRTPGR